MASCEDFMQKPEWQHPEGVLPPELRLVDDEAPQGAFFSAELYTVIDQEKLKRIGGYADPTEIVMEIAEHVGLVEHKQEIRDIRAQLPNLEDRIAELGEHEELDPDTVTDAEVLELSAKEREADLIEGRLDAYNGTDRRVRAAAVYFREVAWNDLDKLGHVIDVTEKFNDTTVLAAIKTMQGLLPQYREGGRSNEHARLAQQTALEAERIIRILIADEIGQLE